MITQYLQHDLKDDFLASLVVFLVALPLCMGVAIASGVSPIFGLVSGVIGGLVVGPLSGSPLQVSGPAAGLTVMVYEFIIRFGIEALAPLGIIIGLTQFFIFHFKAAQYFQAISPALIKGVLSGIGLLIVGSQIHVAFDSGPVGSGMANLLHLPTAFHNLVILEGSGRAAFLITLITLASILLWEKWGGKISKILPAPLAAILFVVAGTLVFDTNVKFIDIEGLKLSELHSFRFEYFTLLKPNFILSALGMALVASAETLLSVSAVDKIKKDVHSDYNKEILAQGIGNFMSGLFGALPITGVIARSSANISAGAKTRGSAIMHGFWLLVLVFFLSDVLAMIPISALAGILIYTGWKLMDLKYIPTICKKSKSEAVIFFVTFGIIVAVDLLMGVACGFVVSLIVLVIKLHNLEVHTQENENEMTFVFKGTASFLQVPKISNHLPNNVSHIKITVNLESVHYIDWAVEEHINTWKERRDKKGAKTVIVHKEVS